MSDEKRCLSIAVADSSQQTWDECGMNVVQEVLLLNVGQFRTELATESDLSNQ